MNKLIKSIFWAWVKVAMVVLLVIAIVIGAFYLNPTIGWILVTILVIAIIVFFLIYRMIRTVV